MDEIPGCAQSSTVLNQVQLTWSTNEPQAWTVPASTRRPHRPVHAFIRDRIRINLEVDIDPLLERPGKRGLQGHGLAVDPGHELRRVGDVHLLMELPDRLCTAAIHFQLLSAPEPSRIFASECCCQFRPTKFVVRRPVQSRSGYVSLGT